MLKRFSRSHLQECERIKNKAIKNFNLSPVNNICLILKKMKELCDISGCYLECGTYKGNTLVPVAMYSQKSGYFDNKELIGVDTFKGFPETTEHDYRDLPSYFMVLRENNLISVDHFNLAKKRTNNFTSIAHLETKYFLDVENVFAVCKRFRNIILLKGTFQAITPSFDKEIALLYLDADLYESYKVCLDNLYDNVVVGGCIIFDKYYSHKYPGPRVAVNEFFKDKNDQGYFEMYVTEEGHERWCFNKIK
jgi:hypothetical protein